MKHAKNSRRIFKDPLQATDIRDEIIIDLKRQLAQKDAEILKKEEELARRSRLCTVFKKLNFSTDQAIREAAGNKLTPHWKQSEDEFRSQLIFSLRQSKELTEKSKELKGKLEELTKELHLKEAERLNKNLLATQLEALCEEKSKELEHYQKVIFVQKLRELKVMRNRYVYALKLSVKFAKIVLDKGCSLSKGQLEFLKVAKERLKNVNKNQRYAEDDGAGIEVSSDVESDSEVVEQNPSNLEQPKALSPSWTDEGVGLSPQLSELSQDYGGVSATNRNDIPYSIGSINTSDIIEDEQSSPVDFIGLDMFVIGDGNENVSATLLNDDSLSVVANKTSKENHIESLTNVTKLSIFDPKKSKSHPEPLPSIFNDIDIEMEEHSKGLHPEPLPSIFNDIDIEMDEHAKGLAELEKEIQESKLKRLNNCKDSLKCITEATSESNNFPNKDLNVHNNNRNNIEDSEAVNIDEVIATQPADKESVTENESSNLSESFNFKPPIKSYGCKKKHAETHVDKISAPMENKLSNPCGPVETKSPVKEKKKRGARRTKKRIGRRKKMSKRSMTVKTTSSKTLVLKEKDKLSKGNESSSSCDSSVEVDTPKKLCSDRNTLNSIKTKITTRGKKDNSEVKSITSEDMNKTNKKSYSKNNAKQSNPRGGFENLCQIDTRVCSIVNESGDTSPQKLGISDIKNVVCDRNNVQSNKTSGAKGLTKQSGVLLSELDDSLTTEDSERTHRSSIFDNPLKDSFKANSKDLMDMEKKDSALFKTPSYGPSKYTRSTVKVSDSIRNTNLSCNNNKYDDEMIEKLLVKIKNKVTLPWLLPVSPLPSSPRPPIPGSNVDGKTESKSLGPQHVYSTRSTVCTPARRPVENHDDGLDLQLAFEPNPCDSDLPTNVLDDNSNDTDVIFKRVQEQWTFSAIDRIDDENLEYETVSQKTNADLDKNLIKTCLKVDHKNKKLKSPLKLDSERCEDKVANTGTKAEKKSNSSSSGNKSSNVRLGTKDMIFKLNDDKNFKNKSKVTKNRTKMDCKETCTLRRSLRVNKSQSCSCPLTGETRVKRSRKSSVSCTSKLCKNEVLCTNKFKLNQYEEKNSMKTPPKLKKRTSKLSFSPFKNELECNALKEENKENNEKLGEENVRSTVLVNTDPLAEVFVGSEKLPLDDADSVNISNKLSLSNSGKLKSSDETRLKNVGVLGERTSSRASVSLKSPDLIQRTYSKYDCKQSKRMIHKTRKSTVHTNLLSEIKAITNASSVPDTQTTCLLESKISASQNSADENDEGENQLQIDLSFSETFSRLFGDSEPCSSMYNETTTGRHIESFNKIPCSKIENERQPEKEKQSVIQLPINEDCKTVHGNHTPNKNSESRLLSGFENKKLETDKVPSFDNHKSQKEGESSVLDKVVEQEECKAQISSKICSQVNRLNENITQNNSRHCSSTQNEWSPSFYKLRNRHFDQRKKEECDEMLASNEDKRNCTPERTTLSKLGSREMGRDEPAQNKSTDSVENCQSFEARKDLHNSHLPFASIVDEKSCHRIKRLGTRYLPVNEINGKKDANNVALQLPVHCRMTTTNDAVVRTEVVTSFSKNDEELRREGNRSSLTLPSFNFYKDLEEVEKLKKRKLSDIEDANECDNLKKTKLIDQTNVSEVEDSFPMMHSSPRPIDKVRVPCLNLIQTAYEYHKTVLSISPNIYKIKSAKARDNNIVRDLLKRVHLTCSNASSEKAEEWTSDLLESILKDLRPCLEKSIADVMVQVLSVDNTNVDKTDNIYRLTDLQKKLITIAYKLCDKPDEHSTFLKTLIQSFKLSLFAKDEEFEVNVVCNLVRFLTVLCRSKDAFMEMRWFLYDALYMKKYMAYPIALMALTVWPQIFPRSSPPEKACPLMYCMSYLLLTHSMNGINIQKYKIMLLKTMMKTQYRYDQEQPNAMSVFKLLMKKLATKGSTEAIILLCKREGPEWTLNDVVAKTLLPIIESWRNGFCGNFTASRVITLLGYLMRPFVQGNNSQRLLKTINVFGSVLADPEGDPDVQEAAAVGVCRLSRHNMLLCAEILLKWKPRNGEVAKEVIETMKPFIAKQKPVWWQRTMAGYKQRDNMNKQKAKKHDQEVED